MKEDLSVVPEIKMKWKATFDMGELYKHMKYWLDYQGFGDENETFQEEKFAQRMKGSSQQIEIRWSAQKNVSDYFAYKIRVGFFILGLKDVEIEKDGRKITTQTGEIEIRIKSDLVVDRKKKWGDAKTMSQSIYEKFIVKDRIDDYKIDLYSKTYAFHDEIKSFFEMHQY